MLTHIVRRYLRRQDDLAAVEAEVMKDVPVRTPVGGAACARGTDAAHHQQGWKKSQDMYYTDNYVPPHDSLVFGNSV